MMAELVTMLKTSVARYKGAKGQSVIVTGEGLGKAGIEAEHYQTPGVFARPGKNARGVFFPIGPGRKYGVILGCQNYQISISINDGETVIYSTTADGKTVKGTIKLDASGNIELNGGTKYFVTHAELSTALQNFITALNLHVHGSAGTPPVTPMSLNISSAKTDTIKTGG